MQNQTRTVTLPNGMVINDVPNTFTDEEAEKLYNKKMGFDLPVKEPETIEETDEEEEEVSYGADIAKVFTRAGYGPVDLVTDAVNETAKFLGSEDDIISEQTKQEALRTFVNAIPGVSISEVLDAENRIKPTRTAPGIVAELGTFAVGAGALSKSKMLKSAPMLVKGMLSGAAADQLLYSGEDNLASALEDSEFFEAESMANDLVAFISDDEGDSALEQRAKLFVEGALLGGAAELLLKTPALARAAKNKYNALFSELPVEDQTDIVLDYLKESRDIAQYQTRQSTNLGFSETAETASQVAQQNSGPVRRFMQQMFTSRGYWTPTAYNAFEDAQYAQRQLVAEAENISNRLQKSLRSISDEATSEQTTKNVQRALEEDLGFHPQVSKESRIQYVVNNYGVSEQIAEEILNARRLIDDMSKTLANSSIPDADFKNTILENAGSYVRRSYRLFEDNGYKPSEDIRRQAEDFLVQQELKRPSVTNIDEAYENARGKINEILGEGDNLQNVNEYYSKVRRVNTEILQRKEDIPEPIRKLMGEITEPSENIILTVSKLARLNETNTFFESLNTFGKNKYLFDQAVERDGVPYTVKITGTNSILDGKYTTPEMLTAIKERESLLLQGPNTGLVKFLRNFATAKGSSQAAKTVYSHVTHLRNVMGGVQFGVANGVNPFFKGNETFRVLRNRIAQGGDKELDALYEKYLRLGIINTNVRVNEFRALLETGYTSSADNLLDNISKKLEGYGLSQNAQRLPQEIYTATDDFYKIANFNRELDTLRKAFPDEAEEVLEAEASKIVQNTFPNYDRVPKGIKALRYLPVGNFVAFPTEIWRTSANIVKQASKEINSGNNVLRARGLQRLAGFTTAMSGTALLADSTAKLAGLSHEEQEAVQKLSETPWSKSPRLVVRMDDKIYVNDTQFIDSYSAIKNPIIEIYSAIEAGQLKGEELDEYLAEAAFNATKSILAPYLGEAMVTEAITDIGIALKSSDGRTPDGQPLFIPGKPKTDQVIDAFAHIAEAFEPGTLSSIRGLAEAAFETPNKNTGKPKDMNAELFTNFTGARFTEFSAEDALMYSAKNYMLQRRNVLSMRPTYVKKPESLKEDYVNRERRQLELQQELYLKFRAAETLLGTGQAIRILMDNGLSKEEASMLQAGRFKPEEPNTPMLVAIYQKTPFGKDESSSQTISELFDISAEFKRTLLIPVEKEEETEREEFSKGGIVLVPNAPTEPDERIDKMTGQPYDVQAGGAFIDNEDRVPFVSGGAIKSALRLGKESYEGLKKIIDDATDNLFKEEEIDDVVANIESTKEDILFSPQAFDDPDIPSSDIDEFDLDEYVNLIVKEAASGVIDPPVPQGVRTKDFSESIGNINARGIDPDSEEAEILDALMQELDPDYSIWSTVGEQLTELRSKYSNLTQDLMGVEDLPPSTGPLKQFLAARIEEPALTDKGREALAEAQAVTLSKDPEIQKIMDELFAEAPPKAEATTKPLDIDPVVREKQIQEFIADSEKKDPVFRGVSSFNEGEYDISFVMPREIGAHVGTSGQANVIIAKDVDPYYMKDYLTIGARGGEKIEPEEMSDFFEGSSYVMDERPMPYTISKGYIQVKNPLVIESDLGGWNAAQLLAEASTDPERFFDSGFGFILESARAQGVSDDLINSVLDEHLDELFVKAQSWDKLDDMRNAGQLSEVQKRKVDILQADINRQVRKMLEQMGFDSIKYENAVESSMVGEDNYSYILFKPQQFKSFAAEKFDVNDPRFRKNMGGYINAAFARNS